MSAPSHTLISTVKLRNVSEAALSEHQHTFVKQMLINAFTCGKCYECDLQQGRTQHCSVKTKDLCKRHETGNALTAIEGLGKHFGELQNPKHRNIWKGGRKTTSMFHVCPGKSSVPRLLMYWGSAELENWQGREVRKPWQEKVKSVLQDMSGTAKLRSKGEKPGVSSIKQGPRMEEFNYNTNYTLCKEFWDVEDSTAKRRAV